MQKWEYGYMYVVSASTYNDSKNFILVWDADGIRIRDDVEFQLAGLNALGAEGWIIAEPVDMGGGSRSESSGFCFEIIKQREPRLDSVRVYYRHFMRRPSLRQ
jgi:hypothetical protein